MADYGKYVLIIGLVLVLNSVQAALIVVPFMIRYASAELADWRSGVMRCLLISVATLSVQIPVLIAGCIYLGYPVLAISAVLAACLWQAQEIIRRAMFQRCLYRQAFGV